MAEIEFRGLEEIDKRLAKMLSPEQIDKALKKACLVVERAAKQKAQVGRGTGDLARSIKSDVVNHEGIVHTNLEYAPYVEYGTGIFAEEGGRQDVPWCYKDLKTGEFVYTSGRQPAPFMRPALDENREDVKRILREGILGND